MAASLLLRGGRAGALKTMLLEAPAFRGFASTVSLSAESGKTEKGLPPSPKKQSPPKNVVAPKESGKPLTAPAAAALSKGGALATPHPGSITLLTDEGLSEPSSRKTRVECPQREPAPFQGQGSDAEARRVRQKVTEPAQAPEPAEPADTTTYKNLQHHSYHAYTFLDLNLALAQHRMPQPSSGRESPRH